MAKAYVRPAGSAAARDDGFSRAVRFLAPFDPSLGPATLRAFVGWAYRFEAYVPPKKRRLGYYAMPLLWNDQVIGWVNLAARDGALQVDAGYVGSAPKGRDFRRAFDDEVARMEQFLSVGSKR